MSDSEKFDVVVVGGGLAGSAAALTCAKSGLEVALIERGQACGTKNMTGGRIYAHSMEKLIPGFADEAPIERRIVRERILLAKQNEWTTIEYGNCTSPADNSAASSYSVMRSKFDAWLAEKAEEAGAMLVTGIRVDKLLQRNRKVCGIVAEDDVLEADCVILADGVNSLLAQKIGMKKELAPHQVAVGVKETISLSADVINDRFGVSEKEGAAMLIDGFITDGTAGGGFLYTNKESVSIGTVLTLSGVGKGKKVPDIIEELKAHPAIAPLIRGGELIEYAAHLVPEGGIAMMPQLFWDGVLVTGDAAGFVVNMGYTFRGMDFAIESGKLAAEAAIAAKERKDFSSESLALYKELLEKSFVLRDMEQYRGMPALMDHEAIYGPLPDIVTDILGDMFRTDGSTPKRMGTSAYEIARKHMSLKDLAALGYRAVRTM